MYFGSQVSSPGQFVTRRGVTLVVDGTSCTPCAAHPTQARSAGGGYQESSTDQSSLSFLPFFFFFFEPLELFDDFDDDEPDGLAATLLGELRLGFSSLRFLAQTSSSLLILSG